MADASFNLRLDLLFPLGTALRVGMRFIGENRWV